MRIMPSLPPTQNGRHGFTLIELLTVMTIIAVLVGLLFPVFGTVTNNARKTEASAEENRILTAISAYQTEYGQLPLDPKQNLGSAGPDTMYGNTADSSYPPNAELFDILRGIADTNNNYNVQNVLNPRKVAYFESPDVKNSSNPRSGFLVLKYSSAGTSLPIGTLVDPWGKQYIIFLDANGDGDLNTIVKKIYTSYGTHGPQGPAQVACFGPDGVVSTTHTPKGSDDVVTFF